MRNALKSMETLHDLQHLVQVLIRCRCGRILIQLPVLDVGLIANRIPILVPDRFKKIKLFDERYG